MLAKVDQRPGRRRGTTKPNWGAVTPVLFIPIVGNVLAPLAGVPLGHGAWASAQFGLGLLFWPLVLVLNFVRIAQAGLMPERLLPTLFISAAPPAVVGVAALQYGAGAARVGCCGVWRSSRRRGRPRSAPHRHAALRPAALGHELPLAALAVLTLRPADTPEGRWLQLPGVALLALASLVIPGLSFATVRRPARRHRCWRRRAWRSFHPAATRRLRERRRYRTMATHPARLLPCHPRSPCNMAVLQDEKSHRPVAPLKRAEGQLRGIQRMIEEGEECPCHRRPDVGRAQQLDSAYVRMTVCFMEQELAKLGDKPSSKAELGHMLDNVETLLGKIRLRPPCRAQGRTGWTEYGRPILAAP